MAKGSKANKGSKKSKQVTSLIRTKNSKEYLELMSKVNKDIDTWSKTLQRVTGEDKEKAICEIQSIYLDNLRKADDLQALAKENVANLMTKQKMSTHLKEVLLEKAYQEAKESGDFEKVKDAEDALLEYSMDTEMDYKIFKAINEGVKTIKGLEPRQVTINTQEADDKVLFQDVSGVYDYDD